MKYSLDNRTELFNIAEEVTKDENIKDFTDAMKSVMQNSKIPAAGLAAPQIGISKRIIATKDFGIIINPVITRRRLGKQTSIEQCLSFPGKKVKLKRDKQIVVEGFNENWEKVKFKVRGFDSCLFQHEIDHLDGITISK